MSSFPLIHTHGGFSRGKKTATANTVFVHGIPPFTPTRGASVGAGSTARPKLNRGIIHVTDFVYVVATTAHVITIMRPLNYTTLTADAAASQAVVNIADDPGAFASNYKYDLPNGVLLPSTANNTIAASDYVMYQAAAGQWIVDTVSSVSSLAVTLATNLPTGGAKKGTLLYFFGITTDTNPATNEAHQQLDIDAAGSGTERYTLQSPVGLWHSLHEGDPMLFHSSNATAAGFFELISGYYSSN